MLKLAIATYTTNGPYAEFIRSHCQLPADIHLLHHGYLPAFVTDKSSAKQRNLLPGFNGESGKTVFHQIWNAPKIGRLRRAIGKYLSEKQIEVLLAEFSPVGMELAPVCNGLGIPMIVQFYGFDAFREEILHDYGSRLPELLAQSALVLSASNSMTEKLLSLGARAEKIVYNPVGYDDGVFFPGDFSNKRPVFVHVSGFTTPEGVDFAFKSFDMMNQIRPGAIMKLIGDGPMRKICMKDVSNLGLSDVISFPGEMSELEIADEMRNAIAFLYPGITTPNKDVDGIPRRVLQAMACGLPVIATRYAGIEDVVVDGKNGFLKAEQDVKGLGEKMAEILANPDLAAEMGKAAAETVQNKFTLRAHAGRLWSSISKLNPNLVAV